MFFTIAIVVLCFLIHFLHQHNHRFWSDRGFHQLNPKFLVGDIGVLLRGKVPLGTMLEEFYQKSKHIKAVGIYFSYKPAILVTDPILLQNVFIRDFSKFHDRPVPFNLDNDPLAAHLFHVAGQKWRDLRVKLSPTFTSGKLKGMFPTIKDCSQVLEDYMAKNLENGKDVYDFRDLMARFNTNIISSVAFGIENDCINEPDHIFRRMGAKNFQTSWRTDLINFLAFFLPQLFHYLNFKVTDPEVEEFIFSMVKQTVEHREKNNIERNDFMQLLIQLKNQGYVSVDKEDKNEGDMKKISFNDIAANVFVFFIAGYETSSSTMSFCLYELAKNPEIQDKVHAEIDEIMDSKGNEGVTYDMLHELKYLECCIDETLRKYPIVPLLFRLCNEDYKIPDSNLIIPAGVGVMIPVLGFHRDPEIYEDPMSFQPERFLNSSNGSGKVKGLFYVPFGDGPRNCIGMRMGKLTAKLGLLTVLSKYRIELADKTMNDRELEIDPRQFLLATKTGINIKITPRT